MGESPEERLLNLLYLLRFWNDDGVRVSSRTFFICSGSLYFKGFPLFFVCQLVYSSPCFSLSGL